MNWIVIKYQWLRKFLRFYFQAVTIRQLDSPFAFRFAQEVVEDRRTFYAFPLIEAFRKDLHQDYTPIPSQEDHGSPSLVLKNERNIAQICKGTGISPRIGRYLFKIIHTYKPEILLELGTGLGISTLYQAPAVLAGDLFSIEASPYLSSLAVGYIELHGLPNVQIINQRFEEALPELLSELPHLDYAFVDGHHNKEARIQYFNWMKEKVHADSVLIFSDIYRNPEMQEAWTYIKNAKEVTISIDLFDIGVVFFDSSFKEKQAFKLVPSRWKWWKLGLFR